MNERKDERETRHYADQKNTFVESESSALPRAKLKRRIRISDFAPSYILRLTEATNGRMYMRCTFLVGVELGACGMNDDGHADEKYAIIALRRVHLRQGDGIGNENNEGGG